MQQPDSLESRLSFAVPMALVGVLGARSAWLCDDAFIVFRYGRNLATGLGLRYNVGVEPPVEGYTQLGWALWSGLLHALGLDPGRWSQAAGIVAGMLLVMLVIRFAQRALGATPLVSGCAGVFLATTPTVVVWTTGGLETMVYALAVFLTFERLHLDPERPRGIQAGLAAALAVSMRADAPFWIALVLLPALLRGLRSPKSPLVRQALICLAIAVTAFSAQMLFRIGYYEDWIPNTARAKVGFSLYAMERGLNYVVSYWLTIPASLLLLLASLFAAGRGAGLALRTGALVALGTFVYCVLVGGDFMAMGRFVLPALPFLVLAAAFWLGRLEARAGPVPVWIASALLLVTSVPALYGVHTTPRAWREAFHFRWNSDYETEHEWRQQMSLRARNWATLGRALALHTRPGDSLVAYGIGALGYYSNLTIFDRHGIVDREVAREVEIDPARPATPGHDRVAEPEFFSKRSPTYRMALLDLTRQVDYPDNSEIIPLKDDPGFADGVNLILVRFQETR